MRHPGCHNIPRYGGWVRNTSGTTQLPFLLLLSALAFPLGGVCQRATHGTGTLLEPGLAAHTHEPSVVPHAIHHGYSPRLTASSSLDQLLPTAQNSTHLGILLWADGRCGTTSFWETMHSWLTHGGMKITPLCGFKEPFHERREPISEELWAGCLEGSHGPHFEHIKPMHLKRAHDEELQTPEGMFRLAHKMGVRVVVTVERKNWLARMISGGERYMADMLRKDNTPEAQTRLDFMLKLFGYASEDETDAQWLERNRNSVAPELTRGKDEARKLGMRVLTFTYRKQGWPCREVNKTLAVAVEEGIYHRIPVGLCHMKHGKSDGSSFHELDLQHRVGPQAAAIILKALKGSEDEWMLDLEREVPPHEDVRRDNDMDFVEQYSQGSLNIIV